MYSKIQFIKALYKTEIGTYPDIQDTLSMMVKTGILQGYSGWYYLTSSLAIWVMGYSVSSSVDETE